MSRRLRDTKGPQWAHRLLLALGAFACGCLLLSAVFSSTPDAKKTIATRGKTSVRAPAPATSPVTPPMTSPQKAPAAPPAAAASSNKAGHQPTASRETGERAKLRDTFRGIAARFEESMRFPPYAKPLKKTDWALLNPRPFVPLTVPVEGLPKVAVQIEVDHYSVDMSTDLPVTVRMVQGDSTVTQSLVAARVTLRNQSGSVGDPIMLSAQTPKNGDTKQTRRFTGEIAAETLQSAGEGSVMLVVHLTFSDGHQFSTGAQIKTFRSVALLTDVGSPYIDGPHLMIPVHFTLEKTGRYQVSANLYDAETDTPVSHINAKLELNAPQDSGLMKVHAVTLRAQDASGPYVLRDITIKRMPAAPGDSTRYGTALTAEHQVRGFSLARYADEAYEDPQMLQRLEFLRQLSQQ